jgi:positive regulator of sigma E activity
MKEKGIVVEIQGSIATIELVPSEACKTCPSGSICRPAGKTRVMKAENGIKAVIGNKVLIEISARQSMIAVFFLFVFPVFLGLIAILIFARYGSSFMAVAGIIGLTIGLSLAKIIDSYLHRMGKLLPKIIDVIKSENT